jgi:hypothetical protein
VVECEIGGSDNVLWAGEMRGGGRLDQVCGWQIVATPNMCATRG